MELGPGRGGLIQTIVDSIKRDGEMASSCEIAVSLLEASAQMQEFQRNKLLGENVLFFNNLNDLRNATINSPILVVAHEYFDALPIYRFQHTAEFGWCEELVDFDVKLNDFRFVLSKGPTPPTQICLGPNPPSEPSRVEVCPDGQGAMKIICDLVKKHSGAGLIMDYGNFGPASNSLRAIKNHKFVDVFTSFGESDLSSDVDFRLLTNVAKQSQLFVSETKTQRDFLRELGAEVLLVQLLKKYANDETRQESLINDYNRLVDEMGEIYKVLVVSDQGQIVNAATSHQ